MLEMLATVGMAAMMLLVLSMAAEYLLRLWGEKHGEPTHFACPSPFVLAARDHMARSPHPL